MAKRKWSREHERTRQEIIALLARGGERAPFADLSADELDALKRAPFGEWCHTFLPDWFSAADAPFHPEADARRNTLGTPVGECWFGGSGKTTRYVIADTLYDICHGIWLCTLASGSQVVLPTHDATERADVVSKTRFVLEVNGCRNIRKAAEKNDVVRLVLKHSAELRAAYGDAIEPTEGEDAEVDFTANGVRTLGMGIGQSLRGTVHAGHRVQKIRWDDVENNEIAVSKEREAKLHDQMFLDWIPRCEGGGDKAVVKMVMNQYRSRYCQARQWRAMSQEIDEHGRPRVLFHVIPLDDGQFHSNWPALYPDEQCKRMAFRVGTLIYNVEFRCREVNEDCLINPEWFAPFHADRVSDSELAKMRIVAACDPNHKAGQTNDPTAWIVMAGYPGQRDKFVLHAWIRNCTSTERIKHQWLVEERFPTARLVMEDEALTETYGELYRRMCDDAGRPVRHIKGIKHTGNKKDRIVTDAGEIERGEWHVDATEGDQGVLVDQYGEIPKERSHDDGPDAAEMASAELDTMLFGGGFSYRGSQREDRGALFGVGRRTGVPPRPGSDDDRFERQSGRTEQPQASEMVF